MKNFNRNLEFIKNYVNIIKLKHYLIFRIYCMDLNTD